MTSLGEDGPIVLIGCGQAGAVMTLYLAKQGHKVQVFESRPDLREVNIDAGRSINLALAKRGIVALKEVGAFEALQPLMVPMVGRMVHEVDGDAGLQRYGLDDDDVIHAISRSDMNAVLLDAAEATGNVEINFNSRCRQIDFDRKVITFTDSADSGSPPREVRFGTVFGCDGTNSAVRAAMLPHNGGTSTEESLEHGYKELSIPAGPDGSHQIEPKALHIWPRNEFMLIALANPEGDFTVTLFLPNAGETSFESLETQADIDAFFAAEFPDFVRLVPDISRQFLTNPKGELSTIRNTGWSLGSEAVLVGDAAHAIVPFHGQGMNLGMESCRLLDQEIRERPDDITLAFTRYEQDRKPDADAIADMALENYKEMRAGVVDPAYLIKRELALEMERRFPDKVAARYGMVMFTTMRYAEVKKRADRQSQIFAELTDGLTDISQVDFDHAAELVDKLSPLPAPI